MDAATDAARPSVWRKGQPAGDKAQGASDTGYFSGSESVTSRKPHGASKTKKAIKPGLVNAVKAGQLTTVRLLLNDPSVGVSSLERKAALHCAAKLGLVDICRELVAFGTDVECRDKDGLTALHKCARAGHQNAVAYLCAAGAHVDALSSGMETPLMLAAERGHEETCSALLGCGANAGMPGMDHETACHRAARKGHAAVCALLVAALDAVEPASASRATTESRNQTALHVAACHGQAAVCKVLIEGGFARTSLDSNQCTPLHLAARSGCRDTLLATIHPDIIEDTNADGYSALLVAAELGHTSSCIALVEHGASLSAASRHGSTALLKAATNGHLETVRALLEAGACALTSDFRRKSPLMAAAAQGHTEICHVLLDKEPTLVNMLDYCSAHALHWAAGSGHTETCLVLIKCGADVNHADFKGQTPFHWAAHHNHLQTCRALIANGASDPITAVARHVGPSPIVRHALNGCKSMPAIASSRSPLSSLEGESISEEGAESMPQGTPGFQAPASPGGSPKQCAKRGLLCKDPSSSTEVSLLPARARRASRVLQATRAQSGAMLASSLRKLLPPLT